MTSVSYRNYTGSGATLYQSFFVPAIAIPVSGELLATAKLQTGERVVDVACGTGLIAAAAAAQVGTTGAVTGVDLAPDMLEVARTTQTTGAPIEWRQADAVDLPFPDGSFDVALCQMGLMFVEDKARAVAEIRRVLTPGGRVVITTPGRIQPPFEAMERAIVEHINPRLGAFVSTVFSLSDPAALARLLTGAGLDDVGSKEYVARLDLPGPAEFLWNYINLTPMGPLVAQTPDDAKAALERDVVEAWSPYLVDGRTPVDQPMALAWARRA